MADPPPGRLRLRTKLIYGSGEWSYASFNTLRLIFYAIFLTDVVRLDPRLASVAAFVGVVWDAFNDPLVGMISDRLRTRWGRRRPFLLFFAVPFGLGFVLLWWAPPWQSQTAVMLTVMAAYMISDTFQTLVSVPYFSLTPEITPDYDERTSLTGYRMFFNLFASLVTAVAAPMIVDAGIKSGWTQQQGYIVVAALFGGLAALPFLLIFAMVRERPRGGEAAPEPMAFRETLRQTWRNVPFRFVTGIYILTWVTFDLVSLMLPYFLVYWVARGNLLASVNVLGMNLAIESAVLGILMIVAVAALPLWTWLSRRTSKHIAYLISMAFWALVQMAVLAVGPGQTGLALLIAALAGLSVSTAHVLPEAILPDVIEWDELRTGRRREGLYYGAKNFIRKLTGALAIFIALQALGWFGYQAPAKGAAAFAQSESALAAIRILTGPVGAGLLVCAAVVAWFYPLTRERHARIRRLLEKRRLRRVSASGAASVISYN